MNTYTALVRLQVGPHFRAVPVETRAYSAQDAKWLLQATHGFTAVISGPVQVKTANAMSEAQAPTSIKPLSPEEARIDSLKNQKDRAADALKTERDRQRKAKALNTLKSIH